MYTDTRMLTVYKSDDGKEFKTERECLEYEARQRYIKLPRKCICYNDIDYHIIKVTNEHEFRDVCRGFTKGFFPSRYIDTYKEIGNDIVCFVNYNGDYNIISLDMFKKELYRDKENLELIIKEVESI